METVRTFNSLNNEFLEKLKIILPDNNIKKYHSMFLLLKKANPKAPLEFFIKGIHRYASQILDKDENFFLSDGDLKEEVKLFSETGLYTVWKELPSASKEAIWLYITGLVKLAYRFYNIKTTEIKNCASVPKPTDVIKYVSNWKTLIMEK